MDERTLLLFDVTGIQRYIFGSNRLALNIGASELVVRATQTWLCEALDDLALTSNVAHVDHAGLCFDDAHFGAECPVEIVYAGGGNAMLIVASAATASRLVRRLTRRVLVEAPGLTLVAAQRTFSWTTDSLAAVHASTREELATRKASRLGSLPRLGVSVTASCAYSGLPAVAHEPVVADGGEENVVGANAGAQGRRISAEVQAKFEANALGKERLHALLPQVRGSGWEFVYDFDEFGRPGESSYIAVVHADGNAMGTRFERLAHQHGATGASANAAYRDAIRAFSTSIRDRAMTALGETVDTLLAHLADPHTRGALSVRRRRLVDGSEVMRLPFRPIVFGGDDTTFVCHGRLGLATAARYIRAFHAADLFDGSPPYARAGVAIVKSHYPFSRAYTLAEELAASAKAAIRSWNSSGEVNAMDWHIATTGPLHTLAETRARDAVTPRGSALHMRPVAFDGAAGSGWRQWRVLTDVAEAFGDTHVWPRNKLHGLKDAIRSGDGASVKLHRQKHGLTELPQVRTHPHADRVRATGGAEEPGPYFDAIESLEFIEDFEKNAATDSGGSP